MQQPEQLANRILDFIQQRAPQAFGGLGEEVRTHVQMLVRDALGRMDLVTREEFAIQEKVLARTRSKLEALEKQVAALETTVHTNVSTL